MVRKSRTVHVDKITNTVKGVTYTSYYLRRTFRQDGKVKHETLGNLSDLPLPVIDLIRRSLKGETFVPASEIFKDIHALTHGHVEAVLIMIRRLGLDTLIASPALAATRPRPGSERRAAPLPWLQAGDHPPLACHHACSGAPRAGRHRERPRCRHGLVAGAPEGHRTETGPEAPDQRRSGPLRRQ